ncbi:sugar ABC transporter substrate-binding protein [Gorillibacterium timonense]|uniref:sugar ABC transporter substrate-binding protein n=1 Tax=Gorillibacterium timonense TaxID=1689269 RepID=UPI00071C2D00|nr:extracellular solute-binding protein [Gorillibacterium timonense]
MKKNNVAVLAVTALLATSLAGCGGGTKESNSPSPSATDSTSPSAAATDAATASTAPTAASGAPVTITVLSEGSTNIGSGNLADLFAPKEEELKGKGISVEYTPGKSFAVDAFGYLFNKSMYNQLQAKNISVNYEDWGWADNLIQKETAAFLAQNVPDLIVGETQMPGFAQQGLLEPFPDDLANEIRDKVVEASWKPMEYNGKIYGLAAQPGVSSLFWNKKLVKEAGIDPDKAPASWEELLDNIKKVTAAGKGKYYGGGVYAGANAGGYLRFGPLLVINGGGFATDGQPAFNTAQNVETVQFLRDLNANFPPGVMVATSEGTFFDAWYKGQLAYNIDGPWGAQQSRDKGIDVGMAPIPLSPNGKAGNITIGAAFYSVPKDAKNKEAAFEYIKTMFSKEIQQIVADSNNRSPVLKEVADSADYKAQHPEMYNHYLAMSGNVQGLPTFAKDNSKAWQTFGDAVVKSIMTKGDIQAILDDAQKKAESVTK